MTYIFVMRKIYLVLALFVVSLARLNAANANQPTVDSVQSNWTIYEMPDAKYDKRCYIANFPKEEIDNINEDREAYILITRYKGKKLEEISISAGYKYKTNSDVLLALNGERYSLFTHEDIAWSYTSDQDKMIIENILTQKEARVKADNGMNQYSIDIYDLSGAPEAYRRMRELCE